MSFCQFQIQDMQIRSKSIPTVMDDEDTKSELPIHLILGASEYSRIKTDSKPRIGKLGEPFAELTTLRWTMVSAGKEASQSMQHLFHQNVVH